MLGEETRYIDKAKLPYAKIRFNANAGKNLPYVCLYDLKMGFDKLGTNGGLDNKYISVKIMDDEISVVNQKDSSADVYLNTGHSWGDSWIMNRDLMENMYNKTYGYAQMETGSQGGVKYFMFKSDIEALPTEPQVVAKYRKIVTVDDDGNETYKYIKEDDNTAQYYTKVDNNKDAEGNVINYIIVDKNGNMLTKTLTPADVLTADNEDKNIALKTRAEDASNKNTTLGKYWNDYTRAPNVNELPGDVPREPTNAAGEYRGSDAARKNKDYRIPALERVYKAYDAFKLSTDSCYSFFEIPELKRVNYLYLNVDEINQKVHDDDTDKYNWKVDDMFFTTKRANWID